MNYIGEHLLPGQLGHFFVLLSFVASLIACIAYFKSAAAKLAPEAESWRQMARVAFAIECFSVFAVFTTIYYIVATHKFEYFFAWNHSSTTLSPKYLLACIWEAQEGSFLLWTMWHCVLGLVLMFTSGKWEAPVMTVISFVQVCLATMIIGFYLGHVKLGINPFVLLRDAGILDNAPFFHDADGQIKQDYLAMITQRDGQGLNQLLQNYWMVIHPPVLFLGFASTIVPFAFAVSGLWKRDFTGWTKIALPWALFSTAVLGLGIMMGAAWAYESLTFGGFWAWDPVENASLVPWLVMVSGVHTLVIYNSTGHSLRATYLFFILSFFLILFSTFLTRSGILGDSSVHAFVENDMNLQLISLMAVFLLPALFLYFTRYRQIPFIAKEESTYSREFWMFIGALVLFLAAMVITWQTSFTPIYNKLAGKTTSAPEDPEFAYNKIQVFVAVVLGILTAIGQYLKYKDTARNVFLKKMALPTIIALVASLAISFFGNINFYKHGTGFLAAIHLAIFASVYTIVANATYIWAGLNGKLKAAGASVAHVGFGLMLLGILLSSAKKDVLSKNNGILLPFDPRMKENPAENLTLIKGLRTDMGKYWATFSADSLNDKGNVTYFRIDFQNKHTSEQFTLYPHYVKATKGQEGASPNPDSKHYLGKDIYSYISYPGISLESKDDTAQFRSYHVKLKDTVFYSNGLMVLNKVSINPPGTKYPIHPGDTLLVADITVFSKDSMQYKAMPAIYWKGVQSRLINDTVFAQNLAVGFSNVNAEHTVELKVKESSKMVPFVALKVYEFPGINLLWLGTVIMLTGTAMSIRRRVGLMKNKLTARV